MALREAPWPQLLALLGQAGERVMINLLSECSVFLKVDAGLDNYLQLTGRWKMLIPSLYTLC